MRYFILLILLIVTVVTAAPAFGQSSSGAAVQEIKRLEDEWAAAYLRGDKSVFDRIVADDYFRTDETGSTADKTGELKLVQVPPASVKVALSNEDVQVRVYGSAAVVTGLLVSSVGDNLSFRSRFTDVFVRRGGRWRVIARHYSRIPTTRKAIKIDPVSYGDYAGATS